MEAARQDDELHHPTANRQIHQSPVITAVDARSGRTASGAGARPVHRANDHHDHGAARIDVLDHKSHRDERRATDSLHSVDSSRESDAMPARNYIKSESESRLEADNPYMGVLVPRLFTDMTAGSAARPYFRFTPWAGLYRRFC